MVYSGVSESCHVCTLTLSSSPGVAVAPRHAWCCDLARMEGLCSENDTVGWGLVPISMMSGRIGAPGPIQDSEFFLLFILEKMKNAALDEKNHL